MRNGVLIRFLRAAFAALAWTAVAYADYALAERDADGMRDVMLCYASPEAWSVEHFRPYVAYLDPQSGLPRDEFFDAWLMLQYGGAPSGAAYIDGPTTKADWDAFLDAEWAPGRNLEALDTCIGQVAGQLGRPARRHPVILMIPYPSPKQTAFGDLGAGGVADLSRAEDRRRAVEGFVDEALRRWQQVPRQHLRLWGFYWMNEGIGPADEELVRQTCACVHAKGYKMYWIPWYRAPGFERWRELGFDVAVMQPNFAFTAPPAGLRLGDPQRLSTNAALARRYGLGVEMEMSEAVVDSPEGRWNLEQYLNHGTAELDGYMAGVARAWYQSSDLVRRLALSPQPEYRQLYDDLYRFHQGSYSRRSGSLAEGRPVTVAGPGATATTALLTDGLWDTQGTSPDRAVRLTGGRATLALDLGQGLAVATLRLHLRDSARLDQARVRTSLDGLAWESGEAVEASHGQAVPGPGFRLLRLRPCLARHLEVTLEWQAGAALEPDEVVIPPDGNVLWGCANTARDGGCEWSLPAPRVLQCLRIGPLPAGPAGTASVQLGETKLPAGAPGPDGWVEWTLPPVLVQRIACAVADAASRKALEAVALPARNAALRHPYSLIPAFRARYPDDKRELADGVLSEAGFPDGQTVGWYGVEPTVVLELGATQALGKLRIHAQGGGYAAVHFPAVVGVEVAGEDGLWRPLPPHLRTLTFAVPPGAGATRQLGWAECDLGGATARRLSLHLGTPEGGWTMLSEIEVLRPDGARVEIASYALRPAPTSADTYSDNQGLLTDGAYSTGGWKGCAGWNQADPEITLDLQRPRTVALIVVHLVGGGAGGVHFPERVAASLSEDGRSWTPAGTTADRPPEGPGNERRSGVMTLRLDPPRTARFLRLDLVRRGWAMVHEVEVY